ncbi:Clathrin light chain [Oleoguttula sp. CCFEE 5521]
MADRFPSLDDFDAGQTEPQETSTSDFLSRERALLGDDAQQFSTPADNSATLQEGSDDDDDDDDDLLGGGGNSVPLHQNGNSNGDDMGDFESSFPAMDTSNDAVGPSGTITGSTLPLHSQSRGFTDDDEGGEPEPVRKWRESRDAAIAHRDEISASKKSETIKEAQKNIDEWYENYNTKRDKGTAQTRKEAEEFLAKREDTTSGGTTWERIAKLVDLSGKGVGGGAAGTGKAKMREVLVGLRKDEKAPGAMGV